MSVQHEYNLCPGCGKTSSPFRGGYLNGGIAFHKECEGYESILTKKGFVEALRRCKTRQEELDLLDARDRLLDLSEEQP